MTRIVVADDHPVVRKGLVMILGTESSFQVVGEARNSGEIWLELEKQPVEILLMDITMPGPSGLDLLPDLKKRFPRLHVLILSQYPESQMAVRAIRAGSAGYLNKDAAPGELVTAIKRVCSGKMYVTDSVSELLAENVRQPGGKLHESLSNREYRVLCLLVSGKTVTEIGELLNLSVKTISTYRSRVLEKLHVQSNAELARYAYEHSLAVD